MKTVNQEHTVGAKSGRKQSGSWALPITPILERYGSNVISMNTGIGNVLDHTRSERRTPTCNSSTRSIPTVLYGETERHIKTVITVEPSTTGGQYGRYNNHNIVSRNRTVFKQIAVWRVFATGQDVSKSRNDIHPAMERQYGTGETVFGIP